MTSREDLKHGQKVRYIVEGYVHVDQFRRAFLCAERAAPGENFGILTAPVPHDEFLTCLEVLEEPKPVWWPPQEGDITLLRVVEDEHPVIRQRGRLGSWHCVDQSGIKSRFTDDDMADATLLVRDGTAYQPQWLAA